MSDIIIRNGLIITDFKQYKADIRISNEKIVEIAANLKIDNQVKEIDAEGLMVLPGGIDPHVHLSLPDYVPEKYRWSDDFESGSKAAIAGGITTLGCISVPDKEESLLGIIERETKGIEKQAIADFFIHPVLFTPTEEKLQEIPKLAENGCNTIKIFMVTDDFDKNNLGYLKAIQAAKDNNMLTMIHCEDNAIIKATCEKMVAEGKESLKFYADSRPIVSEEIATQRAVAMCEVTGAPIYVVHLSSERALRVCEEAQTRSLPVYVEGRPIFLYLSREEYLKPEGPIYVVQPPLREKSDLVALWGGLNKGSIHTVATDHAPHTKELKMDPSLNINDLLPGINELQMMLPMLHLMGVKEKRITIEKFVALTSTNVAKLFGLYPRKGTIQVGSDADIVLWDMDEEREVRNNDMYSQAGFSIYEGMKFKGWPVVTIRRGEIVYEKREVIAKPGTGKIIPRGETQKL